MMVQPAPAVAGDGNTRRRPRAAKISSSTTAVATMPWGPGPGRRDAVADRAVAQRAGVALQIDHHPVVARLSRLGKMAWGLLWQLEQSTPPWPRALR